MDKQANAESKQWEQFNFVRREVPAKPYSYMKETPQKQCFRRKVLFANLDK